MNRCSPVHTALLSLGICIACAGTASAAPRSGALVPLPGKAACLIDGAGDRHCAATRVDAIVDVALSPDGRHLYAASGYTIWTFRRDARTGALRRVRGSQGCVRQWGPPRCTPAHGLARIVGLAVSPDGRHLYTAAQASRAVAAFRRNRRTGRLTQLTARAGCVSRSPSRCSAGGARAMEMPESIVISPDGRSVYTASSVSGRFGSGGAVATLRRNKRTGALRQPPGRAGCVAEDGDQRCTPARGLAGVGTLEITPNGRSIYMGAANDVLVVFERGPRGRIEQLPGSAGCLARASSLNRELGCAPARRFFGAVAMASSPDSRSLYTLSEGPGVSRIMIFRRGRDGRLRQPGGKDACLEWQAPGCRNARGFFDFGPPVASPDGENVYVGTEDGWESFRRLRDSRLRQLPGKAGCAVDAEAIEINDGDDEGCRHSALLFAELVDISEGALVASHDGRHVYWGTNYALLAFRRSGG